jgi:secreted trypsin-like serine protease
MASLACSACEPQPKDETADSACQQIVGGHPDDAHSAVAALTDASGQSYCTGTLIGDPVAVVLTAAHCLDAPVSNAVFGDDYRSPAASARISGAVVHPDFDVDTGALDIAVLTLEDEVPGITPVSLPSPGGDTLQIGSPLEFIGFGETGDTLENTRRNAVPGTVNDLTATTLSYGQTSGGPCVGDSGGPAFALQNETPVLVGVTSSGKGGCWAAGVSTRVQAASSFLESFGQRGPCARTAIR